MAHVDVPSLGLVVGQKGGLVVNMVGVCVAGGNGEPINAVRVTEPPDQMESVPRVIVGVFGKL